MVTYNRWLGEYDWECDSYMIICVYIDIFLALVVWMCIRLFAPTIKHRHIRKTSVSTNYRKLGLMVFVLGVIHILWIYYYFNSYFFFESADDVDVFAYNYIIVTTCALLLYITIRYSMNVARQEGLKQEVGRTLSALLTHRAPIIFLRSFELDKYPIFNKTFDEYVCMYFSMTFQPIISLSDPDTFLPTGGSIKIQSYDDYWKEAIVKLLKSARAVILFEGKSNGLHWEISNLKKYIHSDQLFVVTPPWRYRMRAWMQSNLVESMFYQRIFNRSEIKRVFGFIWKNFADHLDREGIYVQTRTPQSSQVITVDERWEQNGCTTKKGKDFFDYILKKTVKYETANCDYKQIAQELQDYELSNTLSSTELSKIMYATIIVCMITIFAYFIFALL